MRWHSIETLATGWEVRTNDKEGGKMRQASELRILALGNSAYRECFLQGVLPIGRYRNTMGLISFIFLRRIPRTWIWPEQCIRWIWHMCSSTLVHPITSVQLPDEPGPLSLLFKINAVHVQSSARHQIRAQVKSHSGD